MAAPIVEQIASAIETAVSGVTVEAGYTFTVSDVIRPPRGGVSPEHELCVLEQGEGRPADEEAAGCSERIQTFYLTLWLRLSDTSTASLDQLANYWGADVEKALTADPQFSALAIDSWVSQIEPGSSSNGVWDGLRIAYDVQYRYVYGDPYTGA